VKKKKKKKKKKKGEGDGSVGHCGRRCSVVVHIYTLHIQVLQNLSLSAYKRPKNSKHGPHPPSKPTVLIRIPMPTP
jgi:hypothetical protein